MTILVLNRNPFAVTGSLSARKLKRRSFTIAANGRVKVALKLTRQLQRRLQRKRKLVLRLTSRVADPAGTVRVVQQKVTLKLRTGAVSTN